MPTGIQLTDPERSRILNAGVIEPGCQRSFPDYADDWKRTIIVKCAEDNSVTDIYSVKGVDSSNGLNYDDIIENPDFSKHIKTLEVGQSLEQEIVTKSLIITRLIFSHWLEIAPRKFSKD